MEKPENESANCKCDKCSHDDLPFFSTSSELPEIANSLLYRRLLGLGGFAQDGIGERVKGEQRILLNASECDRDQRTVLMGEKSHSLSATVLRDNSEATQ